jgi:hypothetical protein
VLSIKDIIQGKVPLGTKRSKEWRFVRSNHLAFNPRCEACGGKEKLEVHHIIPFHVTPELELVPSNLITLCESKKNGVNCHLFVGHGGDYRNYREDVYVWTNIISYGLKQRTESKEPSLENITEKKF